MHYENVDRKIVCVDLVRILVTFPRTESTLYFVFEVLPERNRIEISMETNWRQFKLRPEWKFSADTNKTKISSETKTRERKWWIYSFHICTCCLHVQYFNLNFIQIKRLRKCLLNPAFMRQFLMERNYPGFYQSYMENSCCRSLLVGEFYSHNI